MFLHLGADTAIPLKEVIAITDLKAKRSSINESFIRKMRDKKQIVDVSDGNAKSFVITEHMIYLSAISSVTLKKRAAYFFEDEEEDIEE